MENEKKDTFFMVYVEGGNPPRQKHETIYTAEAEADRLCLLEMKNTYVLKTVSVVKPIKRTELVKLDFNNVGVSVVFDEDPEKIRKILKTKLIDTDLNLRTLNAFKHAGLETIGDFVIYSKRELLMFRNFGERCFNDVLKLIKLHGLQLGMNTEKYQ